MPLSSVYRKGGETAIASYNFYDLSVGTGYKTFYGADIMEITTKKNVLFTDTLYADDGFIYSGTNTALDKDFDLSVNKSLVVQGDVLLSVPIGFGSTGGGETLTVTSTIKLFKVSGGVETQIGDTVTEARTLANCAGSQIHYMMVSGKIIAPVTVFSSGDTLRISVTTDSQGATGFTYIFCDPMNLVLAMIVDSYATTKLMVSIPFRIDL